jgi:RNA recognition motif-containing protein
VTFKVFVGNLSFKTREPQLAEEFAVVGKVVSANIITRGPRSLGYGFVEFETEADANKAVQAMNKKQIDGREINVEVAKPREEGSPAPANGGGEAAQAPRRGGFGGRGFGGRGRRRAVGAAAPAPAPPGGASPEAAVPAGGGRPRGGRGGFRNRGASSAPRQRAPAGGESPNAAQRAPRTPSATTLFVANLPFSVEDAGLSDIFKEFAPSSAHVVVKRNGRSKGFGFVEFKSSEDQQKALNAMDKKEVQGRQLVVRVAQQADQAAAQQAAQEEK